MTRLGRRQLLTGLGATLGLALVSACESAAQRTPSAGGPAGGAGGKDTVVTSGVTDAITLNPILANDGSSRTIWELIFEPLLVPDPKTGAPTPGLAKSWETSPDGLTYTFHLRSQVTWSDGQPFTAEDVKFTFEKVMDRKVETALRSRLAGVVALDAPDALTFRVRSKAASCPFLISAGLIPIVPKHRLADSPDFNTDAFGVSSPIGTGPYKFVEWQKDDHITVVANDRYWGGRPKISRVIRKVVKDHTVAAAQLRSGELDWAIVQPESVDQLAGQPRLKVIQYANSTINLIAYNLDRPVLSDARVRQALAYGLDRATMVKTLFNGRGTVLDSPILTFSWAYDPKVPKYPYDPERARKLLSDAGWTPGPDGIARKDGRPLSFTLTTNSGNKAREGVLTIAQAEWRKIGVDVRQRFLQLGAISQELRRTHDFDAVVTEVVPGIDPDQTSLWSSGAYPGGQNYFHYSDGTVDQLLAEAGRVAGCAQATRAALYDRVQVRLMEDQPALLLYQPVTFIAHDRRLHGIAPTVYARPQWNLPDWSWGA